MKNIFLLSGLLSIFSVVNAQNHICGTAHPTPTEKNYTLNVISNYAILKNAGTTCIPIRPHIVRETAGTGGISLEDINIGISHLNEYYKAANIEFYLCGGTPDFIDNSTYYDFKSVDEAAMAAAGTEVTNAINMYFVDAIDYSGGPSFIAGYAYFPNNSIQSTRIVMRNGSTAGGNTLIHELGHFFSLYHTFEGTENGNSDPDAEAVARTGANANCTTDGDLLCDTEADPGYTGANFNIGTCTYTGTAMDQFGDTYAPNTNNIMSYFPDQCQNPGILTAEQYTRIQQGLVERQGHNVYSLDCPATTVTDPSGLTASFNGVSVVLNWTDNASNEMGYFIERSTTSASSGFEAFGGFGTGDNATSFNDGTAAANTTYWYRVKASNDGCNDYSNVVEIMTTNTVCAASGNNGTDEYISNVVIGTISNATGSDNYTDYFATHSTDVTVGANTAFTITNPGNTAGGGNGYTQDTCAIWIDWNQDNDFEDPGELIAQIGGVGPYTGNINPPATALSGSSRMRIRIHFNEEPTDPCGTTVWGEVEDYAVNVLGGVTPAASCSQLFISEYGEPSSGNGKYVEIYNPSNATIDLSDYRVDKLTNGGSGGTSSLALTGMLASGDVWVLGNNITDVPSANQVSTGVFNFNGDDVIELYYDDGGGFALIDAVGVNTGVDPGNGWTVAGSANATQNNTIVRKASVDGPNDDWTASAGTNTTDSEWIVLTYGQDSLDMHTSDCIVPCAISMLAAGSQTACVPASNTYTQEVTVTYADYSGSGTLDVNGQSFAVTSSPQTVTLTGLTADGNAVNVTAVFSDDATCTLTSNALFTAPASCAVGCAISSITAGSQTACAPATTTYTQEITVAYTNAPGSGTLDVNGQSFAITSSPQTVTLTGLTADGNDVNVTAVFSADGACTDTENALFTAPAACYPTVELTASANAGNEDATTSITLTATASAAVNGNQTVTLNVSGTNVTGTDYSNAASIIIMNGMTSGTTTFDVLDDADNEITELAIVAISALSAGLDSGSTVSQNILITDNDNPAISVPAACSFETASTGSQYDDVSGFDGNTDHDLVNNTGEADVDYLYAGAGEIGFDAFFLDGQESVGLTDGDFVGVSNFTGSVGSYTQGSNGYQMSDVDGIMQLVFDPVSLAGFSSYTLTLDYFVNSTGYEAADFLRIYAIVDTGELDLVNTIGDDIDNLTKGAWNNLSQSLTGLTSAQLVLEFSSNSGTEAVYFDNIQFTGSNTPMISFSSDAMSGFTYVEGAGASAAQINTVSWANLVDSITSLNAVNYFEFSVDTGNTYTAANTALEVDIPPFAPTFGPIPVQVRLISGLIAGTYNDTIYLSTSDGSGGTIGDTVYLEGIVTAPATPCSQLFISEYGEPSSGNGKYVEIYNPTSAAVDLSDYQLLRQTNGGSGGTSTLNLAGSLASGDVWVVGNNATDVPSSNQTSGGVASFNGDDVIELTYDDGGGFAIIDAVGVNTGVDPGNGWAVAGIADATQNNVIVRKASVQGPNDDWAASAGTNTTDSEWIVLAYSQDSLDMHNSVCIIPCSIDSLYTGAQTACVPASNTYTQEVTVVYTSEPGSGTLDVNGQNFAITSSPQTVTLTGLTADAAAVNVSASFSASATCSLDSTGLFTAPANCSPTCNITSITAGAQTACVPATNTYTQEVTVSYAVPPGSGTLDINGQSFAITTSPQTEILTGLTADGNAVNVTAVFSADAGCTFTENSLFSAAADCTPAVPCSQLFISEYGEPSSGNGKYVEIYNPTNAAIDLSDYQLLRQTNGGSGGTSTLNLAGSLASGDVWVVGNNATDVPSSNQTSGGVASFNGDDVIELTYDDGGGFVIIDAVGVNTGVDPGNGWAVAGIADATQNNVIVRKASVQGPNDDWAASAGTNSTDSEWIVLAYSQDSIDSHTSNCISSTLTWTGTIDSDWNNPGNWSTNSVPNGTEEIVIPTTPSGGNFPDVEMDVTLDDLTIEAGASLNMSPTFGLIVNGTVTNNGTITLQSDASGTAWLDDFTNAGATFIGDITVETFVSNGSGLGQRYFGSPVTAAAVQGLNTAYTGYPLGQLIPTATCDPTQLDASSPYSNLFQWEENAVFATGCEQEGWTAISSATILTPARGYSGWMDDGSTISFTGSPNTGNTAFVTSGVSGSGVVNADGWHLLANPFPSPLDVASAINSGFTSPQIYNGSSGAFSGTYNPILASGNNLAVMQGFVAEATGGATFTALQSDRVAGNEAWLKPSFEHMLEIVVEGNTFADITYLYYDFNATNQFDAFGDCKKRESDAGQPTLYTDLNGEAMSLNGYALNSMNNIVGMGLKPGADGTFTINVDGITSFPETSLIFLEDKQTGVWTNLRETVSYTFTALENDNANRFNIHFTAPVEINQTASSCAAADAEISLDFGVNEINGSEILWDYELIDGGNIVSLEEGINGTSFITDLDQGSYELILSYNNYEINTLVEIDGAQRIAADFNLVSQAEVGESVEFTNLSSGANDFVWSVDQNVLGSSQDMSHVFSAAGLHIVELQASNQDCAESKEREILVSEKTTGIREFGTLSNAIVFASEGTIFIDLSNLSTETNTTVEVFNLLGQNVYENSISNTTLEIVPRNTASYYFVVLTNESKGNTYKVFVK